jgi:hypothetical protein
MCLQMVSKKYLLLSLSLALLLMVVSAVGLAQHDAVNQVQRQFEKYTRQAAQEKIYLHTDKNFYLAGEIVWFKVYYVDGTTHHPINLSKVVYAEILGRNNKPVLEAKIPLSDKGGTGSFYLPLTLSSDNYKIRAYTSWMKNSGATNFFEKAIAVVNTIKPAELKFQQDPIRVTANFFPEGGNLVQGIESKIAFHIADQYGKGKDAKGVVTDDLQDTITDFSTDRFGIGNFILKPMAGRTYKATILLPEGKSFASSLPAVYEFGYTMTVADNKDGRLKVAIHARGKEPGQRGENVFLLTHTRQTLKVIEPGYINYESDLVLYIDKAKLPEGISHLTLFNSVRQPVCERLVFIRPKNKNSTSISSDKKSYEKRQKVNLSILDTAGDTLSSYSNNYSVAVFHLDSLQAFDQDDISSYLLLNSDLHGHVESPGYYFSNDTTVDDAMDNLLLTHGWRRFRWENILSKDKQPAAEFIPEYRGHLITAKITNAGDGKVAAEVNCFLSFPGSPFGLYVAKSDSNGMVRFDVKNYYGPGEIIVQAGYETTNRYRIDILTPFAGEYTSGQLSLFSLPKTGENNLADKSIAMQVQNIYAADSIRRFYPPVLADTFPFYGKAEYDYHLDEYKRFTTMEEVLREYVTPIKVALRNGNLYMSLFDDAAREVYTEQSLVLLDGVPLKNYHKIFLYDPLKVKKIEVVTMKYQLGGILFNGIASFETYLEKFDGFELDPSIIAVDYEGLQLQREFYSPVYENKIDREKRMPDTRSTLYWAPNVSTDNSGKGLIQFYTSDQRGSFFVVLQGFNTNGEAISATSSFIVE